MGALTHNGDVITGLPSAASQINFDKTGTNLNSTQTENAIKEVNTKVNTNTDDITQLKSGLTNITHTGNISSNSSASIAGWPEGNVRLIVIKRASIEVAAVVLTEYWSDALVVVYGSLPESITITKSSTSNDIVISNGTSSAIAYLVIN